jgi:hypothetical protein
VQIGKLVVMHHGDGCVGSCRGAAQPAEQQQLMVIPLEAALCVTRRLVSRSKRCIG